MAVSKRLRFEIFRRDGHRCRYCGAAPSIEELTVDHVVPVALGGSDDPSNLVTSCRPCNSGKSSVPGDAPLVADVAADALKWARAMEAVAQGRAAQRTERKQRYGVFEEHWNSWTYQGKWLSSGGYERLTYEMPGGWFSSIDRFLDAGLEMDDLIELVDVAMGSRSPDKWPYFCGCCWNRITEAQERAKQLLQQPNTEEEDRKLKVTTRWTESDLFFLQKASEEIDGIDFSRLVYECEDHGDGLCDTDTLCQVSAAARTQEARYAYAHRKYLQRCKDNQINDAADEAEDYAYG